MAISKDKLKKEIAMEKSLFEVKLKESDLETVFLVVYYYVDEICKQLEGLVSRPGTKPTFSDAEVITVNLVGQMMQDSENAWHRFVKKNYLSCFPNLVSRSRYHRRCKDLMQLTNALRLVLLHLTQASAEPWHIMDSMPVPVCVYVRGGRNERFSTEFDIDKDSLYGYCASKKEKIYGFKLHLMVTIQGVPVHFVLAPACHHDVKVAPELLESYRPYINIGTDKGYIGLTKKLVHPEAYHLVIPPKENQESWLTKEETAFLQQYRSVVETTNSLLKEQFHIQRTRALSKRGLTSRIVAKITSLSMAIFLNFISGEPLLHVKELVS